MLTGNVSSDPGLQIENLIAAFDRDISEEKSKVEMQRHFHHQKRANLLNKHIITLKNQQSNQAKSMWFNFAMNLASKILNLASSYFGPIGAPIAKGFSFVMQGLTKINPFATKASKAAVKAVELEKQAETENQRFEKENQKAQNLSEHKQTLTRRLEGALQDRRQSHGAVLKV